MKTNFEYYKVFYFCARSGNLTSAAKALFLTQPTVTKTIQNLEAQLGCQLFYRTRRGVELTESGKQLYDRIGPACELMFLAETELNQEKSLQSGEVRLGASEMTVRTWLYPRLQRFQAMYPNIRVKVELLLQPMLDQKLRNSELDFAILNSPIQLADDQEKIDVAQTEEIFACGRKYRSMAEREVTLQEIAVQPLVFVPEDASVFQYAKALFDARGIELHSNMEFPTLALICGAIENNLGIGLVPLACVREQLAAGTMFRLHTKEPMPLRTTSIVTSKTHPLGVAASTFLTEIGT